MSIWLTCAACLTSPEKMAADIGVSLKELVANDAAIDRIDLKRYMSAEVGLPTLQDIEVVKMAFATAT